MKTYFYSPTEWCAINSKICGKCGSKPGEGCKYKEESKIYNADKIHWIPLGTLVELETGERLRVMMHARDCDMKPLYSLGVTGETDRMKWRHGCCEESLTLITDI